jgi:hypothetical protein
MADIDPSGQALKDFTNDLHIEIAATIEKEISIQNIV